MDEAKPVTDYATVAAWSKSLADQWGGDPFTEDPSKLASLEAFCEFFGKNPDQIYEFCFLRRRETEERFASKKRREALTEKVKEFVLASGLKRVEARRLRSNVFSFLSHNGVFI